MHPLRRIESEDSVLVDAAIQMERQFSEDNYNGSMRGPKLIVRQGIIPIVLSSPHAVNHPREGLLKLADTFTGTLALQLASLTGASALVYAHMSTEDPNYDVDGPYKQQLARLLADTSARFVLDLHGLNKQRSEDIAIGTACGKTLGQQTEILTVLTQELTQAGFINLLVDDADHFSANRPTTITSFTWREFGIPALQLEMHKKYRDAENAPNNYLTLLYALHESLRAILKFFE
jgi:hypothetical protein